MAKRGLGKGLGAFFGEEIVQEVAKERSEQKAEQAEKENGNVEENNIDKTEERKTNQVIQQMVNESGEIVIKISKIEPNQEQPRKDFKEEQLQELAESIKQYGILQPLLVQKKQDYYEIIAGERRWRAAKLAGLKEVPVVIREYSQQQAVEISLIENVQREDLNPIEEALISSGHARALLAISDPKQQLSLAVRIVEEHLSVREVEKAVKALGKVPKDEKKVNKDEALELIFKSLEDRMKTIMGTKVNINRKDRNKGKIEIEYYSESELERIVELIESVQQESL